MLLPLVFLFSVLAFSLSGVFGFGSGLILTPLMMLILPPKTAIVVVTLAFFVSTLSKTVIFRRVIDWKLVSFIIVSSGIPVYWGSELMVSAPVAMLKQGLALLILFYLLKNLFGWKFRLNGRLQIFLGSALYGWLTGIIGTASPIKAMVFNELEVEREAFVGAMAVTALAMNLIKLGNWSRYSLVDPQYYPLGMALCVGALVGTLIGKKILGRMNSQYFQRGLMALLFASALALLL